MEDEIRAEFEMCGFSVDEDSEVIRRCLTMCINYSLSPSDLVSNWELYFLNRQLSGLNVENAYMDGFLSYLQNEMKEKIIKDETLLHIYSSNDIEMLFDDQHKDSAGNLTDAREGQQEGPHFATSHDSASTPRTNEKPSSTRELTISSNKVTPFGQRENKFVPKFIFNACRKDTSYIGEEFDNKEDNVIRRVKPPERCPLQILYSQPEPRCRFMYDTMENRFLALDHRIRRHAIAFSTSELHVEPTDASIASQKSIFAVGMICCDGDGHLNEKSILLQGCSEHGEGRRVRIDPQKLAQFSLFPGQVVGIEGHNPSGHCLVATKVIDYLPSSYEVDVPPSKKQAMDEDNPSIALLTSPKELSMVVAAGPFTTQDNLLYEPLTELLAYARRKQPQLLILLGPFIDSEHPKIKNGTVDRSFDDIFNVEIVRRLLDYAEYMGSSARVIVVPSNRDAGHDFVFPQPAMQINLPDKMKYQITSLANPSLFSANEIIIGCCSVDILKHLSGEEISRVPSGSFPVDRMGRIATHLLHQRSWYPLYPASLGVPLDLSLATEALEISKIPHILLLRSELDPFVKVLKLVGDDHGEPERSVLCLNPGRLSKGIGGGTFGELNYLGGPNTTTASIIRI